MSPEVTTTVPVKSSGSALSPHSTAWPVPCCSSWMAMAMVRPSLSASSRTVGAMRSRSWPSTTTRCRADTLATACTACASMLRPPRVCSTLGVSDRILPPAPAASTMIAASVDAVTFLLFAQRPCRYADTHAQLAFGGHSRKLELRRQDSNLNYLNQNQRCCRLHHDGPINP